MTSAQVELGRLVERWQQLPLDQALSRTPVVRPVVQRLADAVADVDGRPRVPVPDLGPATLLHQLTVMVFDAAQAGLDPTAELRNLRRAL